MALADDHPFLRKIGRATAVVLLVAAFFILLWQLVDVVFIVFAGVLLAVLFRAFGDWIADHTPLGRGWGLAVALLLVVALFTGLGFVAAPQVSAQVDQLSSQLPRAFGDLTAELERYRWGRWLTERIGQFEAAGAGGPDLFRSFTGVVSATLGALTTLVVILFLGIYLAAQPGLYRRGFLRLIPERDRERIDEIFVETGETLKWWFLGKVLAMLIVGITTAIGLLLLQVPLAIILALLAALLTFIPNFGPVASAVPAVILAYAESPQKALWVVLLYVGIQIVESYVITPLILRRAVSTPPALLLTSQVVLGLLMGFIGLLLAEPLTAAALVWVRRLWIEDMLHEPAESRYGPHGEESPAS